MKSIKPLLFITLLAVVGCEVTAEKIELWKGTRNGPKKLAGTVIDPEVPIELRSNAVVALIEIKDWDLFRESFTKMEKSEAARVIDAVAPRLASITEGKGAGTEAIQGKTISRLQVDAKDALFILLDFASGKGKAAAETALINWCTADYNSRAMLGQYGIKTIVKKIGPPAADGLLPLLAVDQLVIEHVARLIKDVGDDTVLAKASQKLAGELRANVKKLGNAHLLAAAIIGGTPVGDALLEIATNSEIPAELQRFALRALSESVDKGALKLNSAQIEALFAMAASPKHDQYQREETYYVIAQAESKDALPRIRKLLSSRDSFWRAVGLRCLLRIDADNQLHSVLAEIERLKLTKSTDDVAEVVARVASFPKLHDKVLALLDTESLFSKAVAVSVLLETGTTKDVEKIRKLMNDKNRMPQGFKHKTLGNAAQAALEAIKKRG